MFFFRIIIPVHSLCVSFLLSYLHIFFLSLPHSDTFFYICLASLLYSYVTAQIRLF